MTIQIYTNLSDADLQAKIDTFTSAYEAAMSGGVATVVAGEGRRIEYTKSNATGLYSLLKLALDEQQRRTGVVTTGAIEIIWP